MLTDPKGESLHTMQGYRGSSRFCSGGRDSSIKGQSLLMEFLKEKQKGRENCLQLASLNNYGRIWAIRVFSSYLYLAIQWFRAQRIRTRAWESYNKMVAAIDSGLVALYRKDMVLAGVLCYLQERAKPGKGSHSPASKIINLSRRHKIQKIKS